ncbi:SH3 domain-containing protein [Streptomyces sp. NPDC000994]
MRKIISGIAAVFALLISGIVFAPSAGAADYQGETAEAASAAALATTTYKVAPGVQVNVRSGPGTTYSIVKTLAEGASVSIVCQKPGTTVTGPYGTTNLWDYIGSGYVSDAYVYTGSSGYVAPRCA